jgi:hypothetical protein
MALVVARQEAGSHERWPMVLKGELENNSRKRMDLVGKHDTFGRPNWVSHLPARPHCGYRDLVNAGYFHTIIL